MSDNLEILNHALFSVQFEDGTMFEGGTEFTDTKWMQIPNKKIKKLFYKLPDDNYLCLCDYQNYFHMIEATKDWMKVGGGKASKLNSKPRIEYAYVMGKRGNIVTSYRITLFYKKNDKYKIGDIVRREFHIQDKFIQGLNPVNWK